LDLLWAWAPTFAGRKWLGGVHIPLAFVPGATDHALPEVPLLFGAAVSE
jgi:hypothetical protein